ncbi:sialate O-acetylesterase [Mariniflexile gromovii]|uniref:Sialate O-acetylesterase domain-containing protein n=1 Tax=Mariniflexile gromovii TaxID=362523 RepID=A0ABS4BXX0_9FLAO|nr:sialate O-acetylesterase [Mariniflexile gromovii]MBP0905429.1 hypothetical protein [Mariniflexile gromovii]
MKYFSLFLFLFFCVSTTLWAQEIKFIEAPENYQLYARDTTNSAEVLVSGALKKQSILKKVTLKVFKDDVLYTTQKSIIKDHKFSISTRIHAGLHQYKFEVYIEKKQKDSLYYFANHVVCGDAYIITGQSNSHASSTLSTYSNVYCRSYGVKTGYEAYNEEDKNVHWGLATGNCPGLKKTVGGWFTKNSFGVGVWGMELMRHIVETYQIPVCIINGGSGSSSIEQNMLYPEQPSLETSFGRLAYRVNKAGLKDKVKAVFWHQGESNSNTESSYKAYASNFDVLLNDWKRVYTGLEKVYLFQLHPGCGRTLQTFQAELREVQNEIDKKYEIVEIMSTMGVTGHDGCHFSYEGYLEFSKRIFPLVSRDFYAEQFNYTITPPKLISSNFISPKEMLLTFDQPLVFEEKKRVRGVDYFLKNQFFFSTNLGDENRVETIKSIHVVDNTLHILLESNSDINFISYLPAKFYTGTEIVYNGPWLMGKENNIGALSFYQRPIGNYK